MTADGRIHLVASKRGEPGYHAPSPTPAHALGLVHLHTCERDEAYLHLPGAFAPHAAARQDPFRHLFRVASGLDSRLPGESHVLGQVRRALTRAQEQGRATPALVDLFEHALRVGRKVRRVTPLGRLATDFGPVAARHAHTCADPDAPIAIIGSGAVARDAALALRDLGRTNVTLFARHPHRAEAAAALAGAALEHLARLPSALPSLAVVIAATSSPRALVTRDHLAALPPRATPLRLIDLGEPPNIDEPPSPAALRIDMDDLASGARRTASVIAEAEALVDAEAKRYAAARHARTRRRAALAAPNTPS